MRELFLQIVYGRTQSAFSEDGLPVGAGLEDLGKGLRSQVGTMYGTLKKGPRYLEMAEGYVTGIALDAEDQIIGYQFVNLGKMTDFIKKGDDPILSDFHARLFTVHRLQPLYKTGVSPMFIHLLLRYCILQSVLHFPSGPWNSNSKTTYAPDSL